MVLDLIFALILLVMLAIGAWRGAVVSGSGLFAMIAGYVGGILGAMKGAGWIAQALVVSPLVAPAVAGTIGFVVVWLIVSSIADVLIVWDRGRVELTGRGIFDRGFGAFFGLARGGLIVVLLAVLVSWLDAARDIGAVSGLSAMPDAENSAMARASGNLVESAVATALSDSGPAGEVAARLTAHPGQSLESVQAILDDDRINLMLEDRLFWTLIRNDSIDYAMNRSAIRSIVNDPEMRGRFADVGLVGEAGREDVDVFRDSFAAVLTDVGPKIAQLQQDPEVLALATDSEIMAMVEAGNTFALMNHPRIRKIVSRLASGL